MGKERMYTLNDLIQLSNKHGAITKAMIDKDIAEKGCFSYISSSELAKFHENMESSLNNADKPVAARNQKTAAVKSNKPQNKINKPKEPVNMGNQVSAVQNNHMKNFNKELSEKEKQKTLLNSALRGKVAADIQNALTKSGDGAYLIPEELKGDVEAAKKYNKSISQYVDVIPVKAAKGRYTTEDEGNHGELIDFNDTDKQITEQALKLKGVNWDLVSYGSFTPLSEDLYNDSGFDLMKFFTNAHGQKAAKTENKLVFNAIRAALTAKSLANVLALKTSLNKDLNPALENEIMIVTNQDGFELFGKLDGEGNPIKYFEIEGPKRYFDIYRFEVYSNDDLPSLNGNAPFIYGSLKRAVKLFTGNTDVLLVKNPFGLQNTTHVMRGVEVYDAKVIPETTQLIYGEIPLV